MSQTEGKQARKSNLGRIRSRNLSSAAVGATFLFVSAAYAQDAGVETVVVSASRVDRAGYTAPTPTSVIDSEDIRQQGITNIATILDQMPQFTADTAPTTAGGIAITPGSTYADLRGLGAVRTLVLVDGRRFVPQAAVRDSDQVDLNQIPSILIERTDVVTGGASADWGSDAVGGVINIVLKKKFTGLDGELSAGESVYGDNQSTHTAVLAGTNFLGDRGNIELSLNWDHNAGVKGPLTRPWGRQQWAYITNPSTTNGLAANLLEPNVEYPTYDEGGVINNTALKGITFGPGGTPMPFVYGSLLSSSYMVGGSNLPSSPDRAENGAGTANIEPSFTRADAYSRASYDFSNHLSGFIEATYAKMTGASDGPTARDTAIPIYQDNAYLPPSIKAAMIANNITSFQLGRISWDIGRATAGNDTRTARGVAGLSGDFGAFGSDWKWDASVNYGVDVYTQHTYHNRIHTTFNLAQDPVFASNGDIVCRSTLTDPTNGCIPLDPFGPNAVSPAAAAYVTGTTFARVTYTQFEGQGNVNGEPFSDWAGPVSIAAGYAYRAETQKNITDAIAAAGQYEGNNSSPLSGRISVNEGYAETVIPLAEDMAWARSLELNASVRYADYSLKAGGQTTWKYGLTYTPFSGLMLRAVHSADIRVPDIYELNAGSSVTTANLTFGTHTTPLAKFYNIGNANLEPETALTTSGGISYEPDFVPGLQASVDYYHINLTNEISTVSGQQVSNFCFQGATSFCSLLTFDGAGNPTSVIVGYYNTAGTKTDGLDMKASYHFPLESVTDGLPGDISLRASSTYTIHNIVNVGNGAIPFDHAGQVGTPAAGSSGFSDTPFWRGVFGIGYDLGGFSFTTQLRYVGAAKVNNTWQSYDLTKSNSVNINTISNVTYVDLFASYQINDQYQLFATASNLLNAPPPPATGPIFYDQIGATFQLGIRAKL